MRLPLVVTTVVLAAACSGATDASSSLGANRFDLATVSGASLPVTTRSIVGVSPTDASQNWRCDEQITAVQLVVGASTVTESTQRRWVCDKTEHNAALQDTRDGSYSVSGTEVTFNYPATSNTAATIAHGHLLGGDLRIDLVETSQVLVSGPPSTSFDATVRVYRAVK